MSTGTATSRKRGPKATPVEDVDVAYDPVVPDPDRSDVDRLDPEATGPVTLESGTVIDVVPLRLRETMKLLRIVTHGAGPFIEQMIGNMDLENPEQFAQSFGALVLMSLPDADEEAVDFIRAMAAPHNVSSLSPTERVEAWSQLNEELSNPDLGDTVSIVERVIRRESEDIRKLGKRISQAFALARKVGDLPPAAN